jgi:hypothetical protein
MPFILSSRHADAVLRRKANNLLSFGCMELGTLSDSQQTLGAFAAQFPGSKPRSCEDLKARYYAVARALAIAREGSEEGIANHTIVKHPFNAQHERYAEHHMP